MAKRKVELTDEQKNINSEILARIEAERNRLFEETRALQQQWKSKSGRKRSRKATKK
ncbi:MAG TPA: hypothetical protein VLL52_00540 [Anaerolineae bacterium]|nr:hypothetical protein [Anaerolineae bacterium]